MIRVGPAKAAGADERLESLLAGYFTSASASCGKVERAQTRAALSHALHENPASVLVASDHRGRWQALLHADEKPWESGFFKCPAYQLTFLHAPDPATPRVTKQLFDAFRRRLGSRRAYAVARAPAEDVALTRGLEAASFNSLVSMVTLDRVIQAEARPHASALPVTLASAADAAAIGEIARPAFRYGRFSVEPRLPDGVAGDMHAEWARNCCTTSLADQVLVVRQAGRVAGFIAVRCRDYGATRVGEINLIAVDASCRGSGIGAALVDAGGRWAVGKADLMVVRTELPNTAAVRMYERAGFTLGSASTYYGIWIGPARPAARQTPTRGRSRRRG